MALGKISDQNLAATATIAAPAPGWAVALPAANMLKEERFVEAPARCLTPTVLANSRFDVTLARPRVLGLLGLMFHTLSIDALVRVSAVVAAGSLDAPTWRSEWQPVYGRLYPSSSLPWESPNWWTGQVLPEDMDLTKRHKWLAPPEDVVVAKLRFEIDDHVNPAGFFDIGGLHISAGFSPAINFDRGRDVALLPRDLTDETPSGRLITEERDPRRQLTISWSALKDSEAWRMFDMGLRARGSRPVVIVPDIDDPISLAREAFPAVLSRLPAPRFTYGGLNAVAVVCKEIIA